MPVNSAHPVGNTTQGVAGTPVAALAAIGVGKVVVDGADMPFSVQQ